jgi:rhodanese-related sulfurtransferase
VKKYLASAALVSAFLFSSLAQSVVPPDEIPLISPVEAFHWASDYENVYIVDVRATAEYVLVGHPAPNALVGSGNGKAKGRDYNEGGNLVGKVVHAPIREGIPGVSPFPENPKFVDYVKNQFKAGDILLFICRSGSRSAVAASRLSDDFQTYSIAGGFEGPTNDENDPGRDTGYRDVAGWVNEGLPYALTAAGAYDPTWDE